MSWSFKIAFTTDCLAILVALYFLISDAVRYSSSSNGALGGVTLAMCAWVLLCYFLQSNGYKSIGTALAWIPAVPLLGYALILLMMIIFRPDFK